jgi:hypothetical protein
MPLSANISAAQDINIETPLSAALRVRSGVMRVASSAMHHTPGKAPPVAENARGGLHLSVSG